MRKNLAAEGAIQTGGFQTAKSRARPRASQTQMSAAERDQRIVKTGADARSARSGARGRGREEPGEPRGDAQASRRRRRNAGVRPGRGPPRRGLEAFPGSARDRRLLGRDTRPATRAPARGRPQGVEAGRHGAARGRDARLQVSEGRRRVAAHPTDLAARFRLGRFLLQTDEVDPAIEQLQQAVKDPRHRAGVPPPARPRVRPQGHPRPRGEAVHRGGREHSRDGRAEEADPATSSGSSTSVRDRRHRRSSLQAHFRERHRIQGRRQQDRRPQDSRKTHGSQQAGTQARRQNERIRVKNKRDARGHEDPHEGVRGGDGAKDAKAVAAQRASPRGSWTRPRRTGCSTRTPRRASRRASPGSRARPRAAEPRAPGEHAPPDLPLPWQYLLAFGSQPAPEGPPHHERGRLDLRGHAAQAQPGQPPRRALPAGPDGNRIARAARSASWTPTAGTPTSGSSSTITRP